VNVAKRKMEMLFVRGDGVILDFVIRCLRHRGHELVLANQIKKMFYRVPCCQYIFRQKTSARERSSSEDFRTSLQSEIKMVPLACVSYKWFTTEKLDYMVPHNDGLNPSRSYAWYLDSPQKARLINLPHPPSRKPVARQYRYHPPRLP